jgi:hypothetical protein
MTSSIFADGSSAVCNLLCRPLGITFLVIEEVVTIKAAARQLTYSASVVSAPLAQAS